MSTNTNAAPDKAGDREGVETKIRAELQKVYAASFNEGMATEGLGADDEKVATASVIEEAVRVLAALSTGNVEPGRERELTPWKPGAAGYAREATVLEDERQIVEVGVTTEGRIDLIVHRAYDAGSFDDLTARLSQREASRVVAALVEAGAAAPTPSVSPEPDSRAGVDLCHDDQLAIWSGDIIGSLGMGGYLREDLSYDDKLHVYALVDAEIKGICAALQSAPIASALAARERELEEVRADVVALEHRRRWNVMEGQNGAVLICQNLHAKHEPCDYDEYVPAERLAAVEAENATLRASAERMEADHAEEIARLKAAGRLLDGVEHNGMPEVRYG